MADRAAILLAVLLAAPAARACAPPPELACTRAPDPVLAYCERRYAAVRFAALTGEGKRRLIDVCAIAERKRR